MSAGDGSCGISQHLPAFSSSGLAKAQLASLLINTDEQIEGALRELPPDQLARLRYLLIEIP